MSKEKNPGAIEPQENFVIKYFKDFKVLKETKKEYWGLQMVNMLDCLAYFAMFNIAVVTLSNDFGFNDVQAGLIYTLFSSLTTIFLFFSGVITDWLGIKKALYTAVIGLLLLRGGVVVSAYMGEPVRLEDETTLAEMYDGEGIPDVPGADLKLTARDGASFDLDIASVATIGDLITAINAAPGNNGRLLASTAPGGKGLRLDDETTGTGAVLVEGAAADKLGLASGQEGDETIIGQRIITALNGVQLSALNGGSGIGAATTVTITDRAGKTFSWVGLQGAKSIRDVIEGLNASAAAAGANIKVGITNSGTGLRVEDTAGINEGSVIVAGDGAEALLIDGEADGLSVSGKNLVSSSLRNWLVIICLACMAPFMAMLITVFQAANRRFTTKKSRAAGFNLWYLFMNVGAAGGGFLIDIIYLNLDLPHFHVFTFGVGTGIACLMVIFFTIRNTDQLRSPEEEEEYRKELAEKGITEAEDQKDDRSPWQIVKEVLSESIFWRFTVLISLLLGVRAVFLYLGLLHPKFWYRVIGPDAKVRMLQAFNPILVIIGLIVIIPILNKFNVYKMLVFGALITSVSMFIIAIPPMGGADVATWTYGTTIGFLLVLTVGELIWSPRLSEFTAAIAPEGQEGTYLGLSMVPYFLAKVFVSGLSGAMLMRWCPEPPENNPLLLQQQIAAGDLPFVDSPYMMFTILGIVALIGTIAAIVGKPWFTKGADL